jgi:hypothetical protein
MAKSFSDPNHNLLEVLVREKPSPPTSPQSTN